MAATRITMVKIQRALESLVGRMTALETKIDYLVNLADEQSTPVVLTIDNDLRLAEVETEVETETVEAEVEEKPKRGRPKKRA